MLATTAISMASTPLTTPSRQAFGMQRRVQLATTPIVPGGNYGASTINDVDVSLDGAYNGTLVDGTWQLTIFDIVDNDSGTLQGWDLVIDYKEGLPAVPEPATLLLFGLGLGALASLRERQ